MVVPFAGARPGAHAATGIPDSSPVFGCEDAEFTALKCSPRHRQRREKIIRLLISQHQQKNCARKRLTLIGYVTSKMDPVAELKKAILASNDASDPPFLLPDQDLYRFAACRGFDIESATKRYLKFIKLFREFDLSFEETQDVTKGLNTGVIFCGQFDNKGHPLIAALPRNLDWNKVSAKEMQKTWFFCVWKALCSSPLAQSEGIVLVVVARGVGISLFNREFHGFVAKAVQECMPMKILNFFIVNQPWFFSGVIWPLISQLFSAKIRQRVVMVGRNFELMKELVSLDSIPPALHQDLTIQDPQPPDS
jgi:hypothetical protein